jgi:hypothetical protein
MGELVEYSHRQAKVTRSIKIIDEVKARLPPVTEASYIVYEEGGTYYAKNGRTGQVEFRSDDASSVIQYAIDALGERGGKVFIKAGDYYLSSRIQIKSNVVVEGEGYATRLYSDKYIDDHISLSYSKNAWLRHLRIELPTDSGVYAIKTYEAENCVIDSIYLKAGKGINLLGRNNIVRGCYLEGSGLALWVPGDRGGRRGEHDHQQRVRRVGPQLYNGCS